MKRFMCAALAFLPGPALAASKETLRLDACREVIHEAMAIKEEIPRDLMDRARCVAVIPGVKKAAIGFGGRFGYGAVSCRGEGVSGVWGAPLMISLKGGSFGLQLGGQETDLVLLIMNAKGADYLLRSQFTLGADAAVAAGPVGRNAEAATDAQMRAEILSYSRSRGIFAGISLEGAVVKPDEDANRHVYGETLAARDVLLNQDRAVPPPAVAFVGELNRLAPAGAGGDGSGVPGGDPVRNRAPRSR
jgi:lipid-binding SYLF domain-containing protein